jgi:ketosteroid isomerase-like protein
MSKSIEKKDKEEEQEQPGLTRRKFMAAASIAAGAAMTVPIFESEAMAKVSKKNRKRIMAQVEAACEGFDAATAANDVDTLSSILAEDAVYFDFDGTLKKKADIVSFNMAMQDRGLYRNIEMGEMSVTVVAPDTAVLLANITINGSSVRDVQGREITGRYRIFHVFVERPEGWRLVTVQMIRTPLTAT